MLEIELNAASTNANQAWKKMYDILQLLKYTGAARERMIGQENKWGMQRMRDVRTAWLHESRRVGEQRGVSPEVVWEDAAFRGSFFRLYLKLVVARLVMLRFGMDAGKEHRDSLSCLGAWKKEILGRSRRRVSALGSRFVLALH